MKKLRQYYLGFLSLLFLLLSSVVWGQVDITGKDMYYKTINNSEISNGEYLFLNISNKKALKAELNSNSKSLKNQDVLISTQNNVSQGLSYESQYVTTSNTLETEIKWEIKSNNSGKYLYSIKNQSSLAIKNFNSEQLEFTNSLWLPRHFWTISYDKLENNYIFDSRNLFYNNTSVFFSLSSSTSNINAFKKISFVFNDMQVDEGSTQVFPLTTDYGASINYELSNHSDPAGNAVFFQDSPNSVRFTKMGYVDVTATVSAYKHIPSYKKTIRITIVNGVQQCFNEKFNGNGETNFDSRHLFSPITTSPTGIKFSPNWGKLKLEKGKRIVTGKLTHINGIVTVNFNASGKAIEKSWHLHKSDANIKFGFLDQYGNDQGLNYELKVKRYSNLADNGFPSDNNDYRWESKIVNVPLNSILYIENPNDNYENEIYLDEFNVNCAPVSNTVTIWEFNKWSAGNPTSERTAIIREPIVQDVVAKNLIIEGNVTLPENYFFKAINEFEVKNTGSLVFDKGAYLLLSENTLIKGEVGFKTKINYFKIDTRIFSSPVEGQIVRSNTVSNAFVNNNTRIFKVKTNGSWVDFTTNNGTTFPLGVGLGVQRQDGNMYSSNNSMNTPSVLESMFKGKPNNTIFTVSLSPVATNSYYSLGNPYTVPLSIESFLKVNKDLLKSIRIWRNGNHWNYATNGYLDTSYWINCNGMGCQNDLSVDKIDVGVGFVGLTLANPLTDQVTFNHEVKAKDFGLIFQNNRVQVNKARMILELRNAEKNFNTVLIGYHSEATNEFDEQYDLIAQGLGANSISVIKPFGNLSILGDQYPLNLEDRIKLKLKVSSSGDFIISLKDFDGDFAYGQNIYLLDNNLSKIHNLSEAEYSFYAEEGEDNDRFEIVYTNQLLNTSDVSKADNLELIKEGNKMLVKSKDLIDSYKVFSLDGLLLYNENNIAKNEFYLKNIPTKGVFIVRFVTKEGKVLSNKILN